jgi:hypothetical protein
MAIVQAAFLFNAPGNYHTNLISRILGRAFFFHFLTTAGFWGFHFFYHPTRIPVMK